MTEYDYHQAIIDRITKIDDERTLKKVLAFIIHMTRALAEGKVFRG